MSLNAFPPGSGTVGGQFYGSAFFSGMFDFDTQVSDPDEPWITRELIAELRNEQFDDSEDEHTQVSVVKGQWAVTATKAPFSIIPGSG